MRQEPIRLSVLGEGRGPFPAPGSAPPRRKLSKEQGSIWGDTAVEWNTWT